MNEYIILRLCLSVKQVFFSHFEELNYNNANIRIKVISVNNQIKIRLQYY